MGGSILGLRGVLISGGQKRPFATCHAILGIIRKMQHLSSSGLILDEGKEISDAGSTKAREVEVALAELDRRETSGVKLAKATKRIWGE